jgi:hypothetical protein
MRFEWMRACFALVAGAALAGNLAQARNPVAEEHSLFWIKPSR